MKPFFIIFLNFLILILTCCGGKNVNKPPKFKIKIKENYSKITFDDSITIRIENRKNIPIDSIVYKIDGKKLILKNNKLLINPVRLGNKKLIAHIYFNNGSLEKIEQKITVLSKEPPAIYTFKIINEYPHDIKAYTQGLEFYNKVLYESTGKYGESSLRKIDFKTGEIKKEIKLDNAYFGEGITIVKDKIYLLTWKNKMGFIYDLHTFEKLDSFPFKNSKEGWGLCHGPSHFYKSDGSDKIWLLHKETLAEESYIQLVTNQSIFSKSNELEYVDGKIYANTYLKDSIMIIDAQTGAIEGVIDFRGLKDKVTQHPNLDVLNGIAYHSERKTFFVTGKNWDKLFEVAIFKK